MRTSRGNKNETAKANTAEKAVWRPGMREETQQPMNRSVKDSGFKASISGVVKSKLELCTSLSY